MLSGKAQGIGISHTFRTYTSWSATVSCSECNGCIFNQKQRRYTLHLARDIQEGIEGLAGRKSISKLGVLVLSHETAVQSSHSNTAGSGDMDPPPPRGIHFAIHHGLLDTKGTLCYERRHALGTCHCNIAGLDKSVYPNDLDIDIWLRLTTSAACHWS